METRVILVVGSLLLGCGCLGLLVVRLTNPFFKGLGWLGACFAAGALGATVLALHSNAAAGSYVIVANTSILLAYVFLHVCILELTESRSLWPRLGLILLAAQAALYPVFLYLHRVREASLVTLGVLLALQALQSAAHLKKSVREGMLPPIWFSIALLVGFAGFNLFRCVAVLIVGTPVSSQIPNPFQASSAVVYLCVGLGLGFGVFWITSADIRLKLEQLANTDSLTGLCNRRSFLSFCERQLAISSRTGELFSLIMIDLDHFKQINDRHGHAAGDTTLCAVVGKLRNGVRNIDVVGRWGGEEFVVLLPGADSDAALLVAQRLRRSVESLALARPHKKLDEDESPIKLTISLGLATYPADADNLPEMLRCCDGALYQAKSDGRNRVVPASA